jgi:Flp pilus assembly protein TadG
MDAIGKLMRILKDRKGIAAVYIALIMFALVAFVGLAIDIGYMYVAKGQLQNAADSGALAGAAKLKSAGTGAANPTDLTQTAARTAAITFAGKNVAAGQNVVVENDNSNILGNDNDIAVGNWNGAAFRPYSTPVNAIKVRARRTDEVPGGKVPLFVSQVFGWEKMGAAADAVAALPVRANNFIALCTASCSEGGSTVSNDPHDPTVLNPVRYYDRDPGISNKESFGWTSLLNPVSSVTGISPLICNDSPNVDVCGKKIWTTQGEAASLFKDMEAAFNDPTFDKGNKEFSGNDVTAWWLFVPVTTQCKPSKQPQSFDVWGYAWVRVISVCDTGGGGGSLCRPYSTKHCAYPKKIVIDRIACVDCANANKTPGVKAVLVE